jgi:hypothetical protein
MTTAVPKIDEIHTRELLALFAEVLEELRERKVVRSSNNPVADYTEFLVVKALSLKQLAGSTKGCDAIDSEGQRYEIKGRRLTRHNSSTQLSVLRGLDLCHFDFLVGVLYHEDFSVARACIVPHSIVLANATYREHVNGSILFLRPNLWEQHGVVDITEALRSAQNATS